MVERGQVAGGGAALRGRSVAKRSSSKSASRGALVLSVALVVIGCGGGPRPGFAERADAICLRSSQAVGVLPAPRTYAELRAVFDRRSAIIRREIVSLTDLDPPGELRQELRGLVGAIQDELVAAEDLRVASLSGDIESAQGADYRGGKAERRASLHARQLGLAVCGRPFKTP
jgi:hypothetical protein